MKITLNIFNYKMESWKSEEKIEILSPETKINFAILLGTFLDCPSIPPPPENQISLLQAVNKIESHNQKFQRSFSENLKCYILASLNDHGYVSLKNSVSEESNLNLTNLIDCLQIQYHREKIIFDRILYDGISLYEQLDRERRGYLTVQMISNYVKSFDKQNRIVKENQKRKEVREKLCNNIIYHIDDEKQNKSVIMLENFMEVLGRINGDSLTYKTIEKAIKNENDREYSIYIEGNYKKLNNRRKQNDRSIFEMEFHNTKAKAHQIVSHTAEKTYFNTTSTTKITGYDNESNFQTIKRGKQNKNSFFKERTVRNDGLPESNQRLSASSKLNRSNRILKAVDSLLIERVKNKLKYYDILGL